VAIELFMTTNRADVVIEGLISLLKACVSIGTMKTPPPIPNIEAAVPTKKPKPASITIDKGSVIFNCFIRKGKITIRTKHLARMFSGMSSAIWGPNIDPIMLPENMNRRTLFIGRYLYAWLKKALNPEKIVKPQDVAIAL